MLRLGVAANFVRPMERLSYIFEKNTSTNIETTYASTGKLYAMIINGAPIDFFLAADEKRPLRLFKNGLAERPVVYARGRVVLWTPKGSRPCKVKHVVWQTLLERNEIKAIAIASPMSVPYGEAALKALKAAGILGKIRSKLVFAQSIAQAFQYAHMGVVDCGFVALSDALSENSCLGCRWTIPEAPLVVQAACILKRSHSKRDARAFLDFLNSPQARSIMKGFGYE